MSDRWLAVSRIGDNEDGKFTVHAILTNLDELIRAAGVLVEHHPNTGAIWGPYVPGVWLSAPRSSLALETLLDLKRVAPLRAGLESSVVAHREMMERESGWMPPDIR